MLRFNRKAIAVISVSWSIYIANTAYAIDAVFIPGPDSFSPDTDSMIEVQGFNGRFDLPTEIQGPPETSAIVGDTASGATATDNILYTLLNSPASSTASTITESDTHTGAYLGSIQLPGKFTDIAYTNGQLYGAQSFPASNGTQLLQISSISANGGIQPVLAQTVSTLSQQSINFRLSGVPNGDSLLISPPTISTTIPAETFIPSTPSVAPTTFNLPNGTDISDTIIHADGAGVTAANPFQQIDYSYPGANLIGARASNTLYGSGHLETSVSDEFNYTYTSPQPAYAGLAVSPNNLFQGASDGLYRLPETLSGTETASIQNGVTPDGTTIDNVVAHNVFQQNVGSPLPLTIQETDLPAGSFTNRQIAQANISVNLAGAARGIYGIGTNSNLTADYTTGTTIQTGQPVSAPNNTPEEFAYDPASTNLVGNGDGSLSAFGWETIDGNTGSVSHEFAFLSQLGLGLLPNENDSATLKQILELPTSSGSMELSFSYADLAFSPADLTVSLNGFVLGDISATSTTATTFQTIINNPSLENLTNASLTFTATPTETNEPSFVGLGSITLEAIVPEPTSVILLGVVAISAFARRRRNRQSL